MKWVWEQADIVAGQHLQKPDCGITGRWMIGYRYDNDGRQLLGLVSLADGLWTDVGEGRKEDLASHLTQCGCYKPVRRDEER